MARAASHKATMRASSALSGRNPWSTVSPHARPPWVRAQRSASSISAMLSGPPETATAISGRASNPPIAARLAANSGKASGEVRGAVDGAAAVTSGSAAQSFHFAGGALLDRRRGLREFLAEFRERDAGILLLVGAGQRHAQFQQRLRRLRAFRIPPVAFREGARRLHVLAAG